MRILIALTILMAAVDAQAGVIEESGVKGGLVVVIGGDDMQLIDDLGKNEKFLVQVLDRDAPTIANIQDAIREKGNYGRVSAALFDGKNLPYAENLVNLIVIQDAGTELSGDEIKRVLAPRGVAVGSSLGKKYTKPVPADIDEWTHYLYDSQGNAVSHDMQVHTPKRLQWDSGPRWSRNHDHMSSVSAMVTSNGRVFTILDEGPRSSIQLPPVWKVVARDAFNGKLLWKRDIPEWHSSIWPAKSGPVQLPRRIVVIGDRVFVTLGLFAPVSMLDAATGETLKTFDGTEHTEELLVSNHQLLITGHAGEAPKGAWKLGTVRCWDEARRANNSRPWNWNREDPKKISLIDISSGKTLWSKHALVAPNTLATDDTHVLFYNGQNVVCLDRKSGEQLWASQQKAPPSLVIPTKAAPNLVIHGEVVLFSANRNKIISFSLEDGSILWNAVHGGTGHQSATDLLVAGGLVWCKARDWTLTGHDPVSGEVIKVIRPGKSDWFHHRCHGGRATDNYLIMARTGIEFIDLETGKWKPNPWVRGACLFGFVPANGLTYAPPHPCGCYIESKLTGFNALAGAGRKRTTPDTVRLVKGPAFGKTQPQPAGLDLRDNSADWPTYRCNNKRSGSSSTRVSANLRQAWQAPLGGKLSPTTIADGKVFVAAVDQHRVYALDSDSGKTAWTYTAGGRVDTPPTIYGGMAIFGCRDGWVYCLRVSDGQLAWRRRVAPEQRTIVSYDQLESAWPVHGAVLVQDGSVYGVAGRSMFLDGGLHLFKLDARTGELQLEEIMDDTNPETGQPLDKTAASLDMPVALADILSSDGKRLYMRSQVIGMDGKRTSVTATKATDQGGEEAHLICSSGFLDDSWFHRAYWVFGRGYGTGHNGWFRAGRFAPSGRMLVFNDDTVFGYGRLPNLYVWSSALEYQLYSAKKEITQEAIDRVSAANRNQEGKMHGHGITFDRKLYGSFPLKEISAIAFNWRKKNPSLQARAMTLAGDTLFIAGPPDLLDEEEKFSRPFDKAVVDRANDQVAALEGKKGSLLQIISTSDGSQLREMKLDSTPVFDGLSAAGGRLYMSTTDGKVLCFQEKVLPGT